MSIKPLLPLLLCLFLLSASSVNAVRDPRLEQCRQKCFQRQQYSEEERRQCEQRCERQYGQGKGPERERGSQELDQCKQQCKRQQRQERQQCEQGCEEMYGKGREQERERSQELQQCKHGCMQEEPQVRQLCEQQCEAAFGGERRGGDYRENKEEGGRDNPYFFGKDRFQSMQRSEGGQHELLEKFNKGSELLRGLENYRIAVLGAQPNTFTIPAHGDFEAISFVASGRGKITFLYEDSQESHDIQKGDIIRSPPGIITYLINKEQQQLQIVTIGRVISISGRSRFFYAAGGENPESFLRSFSSEILQAAFNTPRERIEKVFGQQKRGAIIRASPEQIGALSRGKSEGERNRPYNLFKEKRPSYSNNRGQLSEAYPSDFPQLEDLDVAVSFAKISQGAMIAPSYNSRATKIAMVVGGKGYFEMACPHLSRQQDQGKTGQSYRKISSQLSPGDVFVVPAGHPFVAVASRDENLEILCFDVNAQGNEKFFLAGKNNVLKNIEKEAKELSFAVPAKEVDEMFDAQRETVFLPGPGQRQQEREGREGGHGDLASTLGSIFF